MRLHADCAAVISISVDERDTNQLELATVSDIEVSRETLRVQC